VAAPLLRELGRLRGLALRRGVQRIGCGGRLGAAGGQRGPRIRRSCARVRGFCLQCRAARLELHDLGFRLRPARARQRCSAVHRRAWKAATTSFARKGRMAQAPMLPLNAHACCVDTGAATFLPM